MKTSHLIHHALRQEGWQLLSTKLDPRYTYHSVNHTREVCCRVNEIAKALRCSPAETELLYTAAVYHDAGFTVHHTRHEEKGADIFRSKAILHNLPDNETEQVCQLILGTVPFAPANDLLECIIKDADLFYLSTPDYERQAALLKKELEWIHGPLSAQQWREIQTNFLRKHHFLTPELNDILNHKKKMVLKELQLA